jgi:YHS domain-containing protein
MEENNSKLNNMIDKHIIYKCNKDECINNVNIYKSVPNLNGYCENVSTYMHTTASGYRNKYSSFRKYYFCSENCLEHFKKYNCCHRCNEDGKGNFVEELGYTLCYGRGDGEQCCILKYQLELRLTDEYEKCKLYEIDTELKDKLLHNCDELKQIITDYGNRISYNMLMDIYNFYFYCSFELQEIKNTEENTKKQFDELCDEIKKRT